MTRDEAFTSLIVNVPMGYRTYCQDNARNRAQDVIVGYVLQQGTDSRLALMPRIFRVVITTRRGASGGVVTMW